MCGGGFLNTLLTGTAFTHQNVQFVASNHNNTHKICLDTHNCQSIFFPTPNNICNVILNIELEYGHIETEDYIFSRYITYVILFRCNTGRLNVLILSRYGFLEQVWMGLLCVMQMDQNDYVLVLRDIS